MSPFRIGRWLIFLTAGLGQAWASGADADLDALLHLEDVWNNAHLQGDAAALDALWADELVVTVPKMTAMTKEDAIGIWRSGRMRFDRYQTSETRVKVFGDAAVVTGRLLRGRQVGEVTREDDWRFTKVYLRRAGKWQVVAFHASTAESS